MNEIASIESVAEAIYDLRSQIELVVDKKEIKPILFREWAILWLDTWRKGIVSDISFFDTYRRPVIKHLIPFFGDCYLHTITPLQIQQFFNAKAENYTMESLRKMKFPLISIFTTGIENQHCLTNPVTSSIRLHSKIPPAEKGTWTQDEYNIVAAFAKDHPNGLCIMLLMETAMTRSEMLGLRIMDVDLSDCTITICGGTIETRNSTSGSWEIQRTSGKNSYRLRKIPISKDLSAHLSAAMAGQKKTNYVFKSKTGGPKCPNNWYKREYRKFMKDLKREYPDIKILTPHELRHTRATLLVQQGVDLYTVAHLLGHCDLSMLSKRYLHSDVNAMRKAIGL
ncbi:MAG: tyrosine-type recombinase/integrase [Oscillibacter sp.]|nr:tyrosine-type recombinase/integrase [Oscillibacter sp.]